MKARSPHGRPVWLELRRTLIDSSEGGVASQVDQSLMGPGNGREAASNGAGSPNTCARALDQE